MEGREQTRKKARTVISLRDVFRPVAQRAIADYKVQPAARQVRGVNARNSANRQCRRGGVERAVPAAARDGYATAGQPVDRREREALGFAVIPAEANERSNVLRDFLLHIHPKSVFASADAQRSVHVGSAAGAIRKLNRLRVPAGIGAIEKAQYAQSTGMAAGVVPQFALECIAAIAENSPGEAQAIGGFRLSGAAISKRPAPGRKTLDPTPPVTPTSGPTKPPRGYDDA